MTSECVLEALGEAIAEQDATIQFLRAQVQLLQMRYHQALGSLITVSAGVRGGD